MKKRILIIGHVDHGKTTLSSKIFAPIGILSTSKVSELNRSIQNCESMDESIGMIKDAAGITLDEAAEIFAELREQLPKTSIDINKIIPDPDVVIKENTNKTNHPFSKFIQKKRRK